MMADDTVMAEQLEAVANSVQPTESTVHQTNSSAPAPVPAPPHAAAPPPAVPPAPQPVLAGPAKHLMATRTYVNALLSGEVDKDNAVVQWTMRTMLDLTEEAVTLGVTQNNGAKVSISPKDVKLPVFKGSADANARTIPPSQYLAVLEWLKGCEFQLRASGLAESLFVPHIVQHLEGAARNAFMTRYGNEDVRSWSYEHAKSAILDLVPEYKAKFMSQALEMAFRAHKLADDVARFHLYTTHMEQSPDGSRFWRDMLVSKVVDACPDLLTMASARYNKRLDHVHSFDVFVGQVQSIIAEVSANEPLCGPSRAESAPQNPRQRDRRQRDAQKRRAEDTPSKVTPKRAKNSATPLTEEEVKQWRALANKYGRCVDCGWLPNGRPHGQDECVSKRSGLRCNLCCAAYTILRPRTLHTPAKGDARRQDVSGDSVEDTQPRRLASPGGE
jgi:hypothetical protein